MVSGFSFDRALAFAFKAPHAKSFIWKYAVAYGVFGALLTALFGALLRQPFVDFINEAVALDAAGVDGTPDVVFDWILGGVQDIAPLLLGLSLLSWLIWAVFQSASYRRYIRNEDFNLQLGGDEFRMMVVSFLWTLLGIILFLPMILILLATGVFPALATIGSGDTPPDAVFIGMGVSLLVAMFVLFPIYVFFATRLSPCFALTIKMREIRFFDAWNVTRKRFWPILGAFVILAVAGSIALSIFDQIFQFAFMSSLSAADLSRFDDVATVEEAMELLFTPVNIAMVLVYIFVTTALKAVYDHVCAGPAALAARYDPRNDDGLAEQVDIFS